jgi:replicative DNA helicase
MDQEDDSRSPFYNREAEYSVLGGLLLDNGAYDKIADLIDEDSFFFDAHRILFRAIIDAINKCGAADIITVGEILEAQNLLSRIGGLAFMGALAQNTPSAANIRRYAEIVNERSIIRLIHSANVEIEEAIRHPGGKSAAEILDFAQRRMISITDSKNNGVGFTQIAPYVTKAIQRIDELYEHRNDEEISGLSTGFKDIDKMTAGLQGGDLVIIAARPSMGKTSFALNISEHLVLKKSVNIGIFSMEMSGIQITNRLISSVGNINQHRVRVGRLYDSDWPKLTDAAGKLNQSKFYIDEEGGLSHMQVRSRARKLHKTCGGLGMIVIDYLQLMEGGEGHENRATQVSEISRSLKSLAKELNIPVVALSQLNRAVESRPNKRPMMSDLRESGAIEQDADLIMFIYRDEMYNQNSPDRGIAEIIIGKQRNGPIGTVRLLFRNENTRFENVAENAA